jgi:hypothetical protein
MELSEMPTYQIGSGADSMIDKELVLSITVTTHFTMYRR